MSKDKIIQPKDECIYINGYIASKDKEISADKIEKAFIQWMFENDFYFSGCTKKDIK